jgi:hypothetical protein
MSAAGTNQNRRVIGALGDKILLTQRTNDTTKRRCS